MIKIIGLTEEFDLLPLRAVTAIREADAVILQSGRAGCAARICEENGNVHTLDALYEEAEDFDKLYREGAAQIAKEGRAANVVFGVIGTIADNGFIRALAGLDVPLEYLSETGAVETALLAATERMDTSEYAVLCARRLDQAYFDTSHAIVVTDIDNAHTAETIKCILADFYHEDTEALLYADGEKKWVRLLDLDQIEGFRTGGLIVLPPQALKEKERYGLYDLVRIMKVLRGENGCPWDAEQTHKSLRQYILEEAYEVVDAVDADDMCALYDELGDVYLQVVFQSEIARQCGEFDVNDVATAVCSKMIHRHPHIFGDVQANTAGEVFVNWEAIKRKEKKNKDFASVLRDVPRSMGAMMRAYKLQKKASAIGFDWENAQEAMRKVKEELGEWEEEIAAGDAERSEAEAGDLLFAVINVLRLMKTNPEVALNRTCQKFVDRMEHMEQSAKKELSDLPLKELDKLWEEAKKIYQ